MSMITLTRYVDADSYYRGSARYQKTLSRWQNVGFAGNMTTVLGIAIAGFVFTANASFSPNVMGTIFLVGSGVTVLGAVPLAIQKYMFRRHKIDNFVYRIALHFMREMGIQNPETVLARNPRYLEAFEEVRKAVTTKEAENNGISAASQSLTPLSRRIGSLILRDEKSLSATPRLLPLIEDRGILDYDNLGTLLDSMNDLPPSIAEGAI